MTAESRTINGSGAETAPLLGPPDAAPGSPSEAASSHGTFAGTGNGAAHAASGLPQRGEIAGADGSLGGDPVKQETRMAVLLPALAIGIFLTALDQTLTIATYGKIGSDLQALNSTGWVATSYFLTVTTFQPLSGKLSDIFGRKPCLLLAYAIFGFGCLGCGLARNIVELCVARAISGVGGGGMSALVSILITDLVSLRDRGVWQGYINVVFAAGMSAGAPVGGLFADSLGWRWAFLIQCPIALLAFVSVYLVLHIPQTPSSSSSSAPWTAKVRRVDFAGALTLMAAVFLLLLGLDRGSNGGWGRAGAAVPLALAPALLAAFAAVESSGRLAREPFAPGRVVLAGPLLAAYGANLFGVAAHTAVLFLAALFFQAALALSATASALLLLPGTFFSLAGSLAGGFLVRRSGRYYWLSLSGYCLVLLGTVPLALGVGSRSVAVALAGLCVLGLGAAMSITTTLVAIIANAAPADSAVAIACSYLFRSLGTTLGVSVSTATLQQMLRVGLARELDGSGGGGGGSGSDRAREIEEQVRLSLDYIRTLDPAVAAVVRGCYAVATRWALVPVAGFAALAIASSVFIKERKLDR
ncbi:putative multidrug resistance protein fnx1 [Rosellinia necatrix]|uniref:Putative multidrug resistance protein fnx1 n=1 Tax=Rosellinia necatrix TaxID=77044 RepID=A0A1S8A7B0_ROSNE|nr:putative multidrug resistance protein fnx1 [Rosellinia necatrix]